jgi:hypothetical protein
MAMHKKAAQVQLYRLRADECRSLAAKLHNEESRAKLLKQAADYEKMAAEAAAQPD